MCRKSDSIDWDFILRGASLSPQSLVELKLVGVVCGGCWVIVVDDGGGPIRLLLPVCNAGLAPTALCGANMAAHSRQFLSEINNWQETD